MIEFDFNSSRLELGSIMFPGPSMLSKEEAVFYYFLGKHVVTGVGNIVDAGCWLGSSTYYIAKGIEDGDSLDKHPKILSFDLFRWENSSHLTGESKRLQYLDGDDFSGATRGFLSTIKLDHDVCRIDYSISPEKTQYYPEQRPIEVLLIDAGKTPDLLLNILEGYLPFGIENRTLVFFQDYRDYFCWFTPAIVEMLEDVLKPVKVLEAGGACFVLNKKETLTESIQSARERFVNNEDEVIQGYDRAIKKLQVASLRAWCQAKANRVAMLLHFYKVTEVYFGPVESRQHHIADPLVGDGLISFIKELDKDWPNEVNDVPLQNAYRRVMHGIQGRKDLSINFKSFHYYKRRLVNPAYLKLALIGVVKYNRWIYQRLRTLKNVLSR